MAKRKRSTVATVSNTNGADIADPSRSRTPVPLPANVAHLGSKPPRRQPSRGSVTNPDSNPDVVDGLSALRASPDGHECGDSAPESAVAVDHATTDTAITDIKVVDELAPGHPQVGVGVGPVSETPAEDFPVQPGKNKRKKAPPQQAKGEAAVNRSLADDGAAPNVTPAVNTRVKVEDGVGPALDLEGDAMPENDIEAAEDVTEALSRPPAVNSDYLPLPWKGRLGYACLNTYLRNASPPVFSSRTCRIASILEHRHPLKDPSQPEHPTKNRPDKDQPADIARGQKYVEELGLANARDLFKMLRWNDKYGIKFMRLSSEMFPFASHEEYGYKLAPFASETLAQVGKIVAELGHRVTTHPGQFTQLGSPRKEVINNAIRDLEYHDELLSLLKLPPQQDRDAVMILHLGGAFGDKPAAIERFRQNYARLPQSVKNRLVLENDDVVWSTHEILPLCQELNIPFVLDFHHHNIVFDSDKIREGTKDIVDLFPTILETWSRKNITPKMHYSEPCPGAITGRSRRKHSPRVMTLPPCPDTMDLMIEAKDKEQAVFELMRTFKLPGFHLFNDVIPYVRQDENKPFKPKPKKAAKKSKKKKTDDLDAIDEKIEDAEEEEKPPPIVPDNEVSMGGPESRVYWPVGMEEWLRPPKRIVKKKDDVATPAKKKRKVDNAEASVNGDATDDVKTPAKKAAPKKTQAAAKKKAPAKAPPVPTPSASDDDDDDSPLSDLGATDEDVEAPPSKKQRAPPPSRKRSGRVSRVSYKEEDADQMSA